MTTEAGGTASFSVALTSAPTNNVTLPLSSGDLTEGTVSPASLTFTPANWNVAQTVTVTGVDDLVDDGNMAYSIVTGAATSSDPGYSNLNPSDVSVSNTDNDTAAVLVSPTSGLTTTEAGGTATFDVALATQPTANVTIGLASNDTSEGTASPTSLTFTPANWNTPQTATVTGANDQIADGNVGYTIVTTAGGADPVYVATAIPDVSVTNSDDSDTVGVTVSTISRNTHEAGDTATFSVALNSEPTANVTIALSSSNAAEGTVSPASLTFTAANWNTPQTATVTGVNDSVDDGDVGYTIITGAASSADAGYNNLAVADVSVTNSDDDTAGVTVSTIGGNTSEAGGTASFTVVLDSQPTADVTIALSSSDTTEGTVSPTSLTFTAANWNVAQSVTATGVNDNVDDGDISYTIVTAAATSDDPNYNNFSVADVSVTNTDDDGFGINVSAISGSTSEAGDTASFTVALSSEPTADVTIALSSDDATEGTVSPASLTFTAANWNVAQSVTVAGVNDDVDDGDIGYDIVMGAASSDDTNYSGLDAADVNVTNSDDDTAGVTVSAISGNTSEAGGNASFSVVLNSEPTADVTIALSSSDATEGTVSPASLTFTAANWNVAQSVIATGADDSVDDGDISYTIVTDAATSDDPNYDGWNPADVAAANSDDDTAGITVSTISGSTSEAGGSASFTVVLDSEPTADVTIDLSSDDTSEGSLAQGNALTFTPGNWSAPQTVFVTGVNDDVDDGDISYTIVTAAAKSNDANYDLVNPADVAAANSDDDTAGVTVSAISGNTSEAGGSASFTVVLDSEPTADVKIGIGTDDATEGLADSSTLTFTGANWNVAQTITLSGVNDNVDDGDIAYNALVTASSNDVLYDAINPGDVSVTNTDDDGFGINVSVNGSTTTEAGGVANFKVTLNSEPTADVTIALSSDDTTEGTVSPASLTFTAANWNVAQSVTVAGVNDAVDDGDMGYDVVIAAATSDDANYSGLDAADLPITNSDDDTAGITVSAISGDTSETGGTASFTVVLDSQPTDDVTIGLSSSDTTEGTVRPASLTFTAANWSVAQSVTVNGADDSVDDGNIAYTLITSQSSNDSIYAALNPADLSLSNVDDDTAGITVSAISGDTSEAGGTASFSVVLDSQPTDDVTIGVSSGDVSEGTVSPASLTFTAANWNVAQSATVNGADDSVDDGDIAYSAVIAAAGSGDANYNGRDPANLNLSNLDDDTAGITVSAVSNNTSEAGGTASFSVVLDSQPTDDVTIALSSSNTAEGTVSPASLTFTAGNWSAPQAVTVAGVNDNLDDGDISYSVVIGAASSADAGYNGKDPADEGLSNTDDDGVGFVVSLLSGESTEAGGSASFTVRLNSQPTADVSVALSSSDTGEGAVSPASLTFTPANWNVAQTVTVTGANDDTDDGEVPFLVVLAAATSADGGYNGQDAADVPVTTTDDDAVGIIVTPTAGLTTGEAGGSASFTVRLNSQPTGDVTIALSSSDASEGTVSPASLTFTPANWNVAQSVTVIGTDDQIADASVAYAIVTQPASSSDSNYNLFNAADVGVTNSNNDTAGITVSAISGSTSEAGGKATFTVALTSQPVAPVNVSLASTDTGEGTVSPAMLTFTPGNWDVAQTVTATGVNDDEDDGDAAYTIGSSAVSSADQSYAGRQIAGLSVVNVDDDTAGVRISTTAVAVTEGGAGVFYTVALDSKPTSTVVVTLSGGNQVLMAPSTLTFTPANWNQPQQVAVSAVNDAVFERAHSATISHVAASDDLGYNARLIASVTVNITDDETSARMLLTMVSKP